MFEKIISGGQTGVDRAALDVALELNIPCGGWCPKGRIAEDGPIDFLYPLTETDSSDYITRTEKNVEDSDGTLILNAGPLNGGTALTIEFVEKHKKPCLVADLNIRVHPVKVRKWGQVHKIKILNVAGPRESKAPGIHEKAQEYLREVIHSRIEKAPKPGK